MADFVPGSDPGFDKWCRNFIDKTKEHMERLGMSASEVAELTALYETWRTAWQTYVGLQTELGGQAHVKKDARRACEQAFRRQAGMARLREGVNDELRVDLGLKPRERAPAPEVDATLIDPPDTKAPPWSGSSVLLRFGGGTRHRGKPKGIKAIQVEYTRAGRDAPDKEWTVAGFSTRTAYGLDLPADSEGRFWFRARWVDAKMRLGHPGAPAEVEVRG